MGSEEIPHSFIESSLENLQRCRMHNIYGQSMLPKTHLVLHLVELKKFQFFAAPRSYKKYYIFVK